jgi:hypothetical protein
MPLSPDKQEAATQILTLFRERQQERSGIFRRMSEIRDHYNGDVIVPLPELDELEKPAIPNLIAQGIDQFAMQVASVIPDVQYPSLRPGMKEHDNRAEARRDANKGWWDMNRMGTKIRRRARHLTAYDMSAVSISPVSIDPNDKREIPHWRVRNPLSTYPAPLVDPDSFEPMDCIFVDRRPLGWLKENYPQQANILYRGTKSDHDLFEILEYVDSYETVWVAIGAEKPKTDGWSVDQGKGHATHIVLDRIPNRIEMCPVVVAGRITLDRLAGQFDQMIGMYQREAKLDALNTIAVFRNVFPDEWVVSTANGTSPKIVQEADGKMGIRGIVNNGQLQTIHPTPGQEGFMLIDRLERNQRVAGKIPAEFGGESPSNVRTGRRGADVVSNTVDMSIQEYQEIFENSLEAENLRAVRTQKMHFGKKPSMFFFGMDGKIARPDYTPNDIFDVEISKVVYPMPGTDASSLTVAIGQKVGMGTMSTHTAMILDPTIENPIKELERIEIEGLRKSLMTSLEQQAVQGQLDANTMSRIIKKRISGLNIEDAVSKVHEEMQQEQQEQQQQMAQQQQPSPDMQPGMAAGPENPPMAMPQQGAPDIRAALAGLHGPGGEPAPMPGPSMGAGPSMGM